MKIFVFTAVLLLFQTLSFAAEPEPYEPVVTKAMEAWERAGYSLEQMNNEFGFRSQECRLDLKLATGCVVALDFLARLLPEPLTVKLQTAPDTGEVSYVLEPVIYTDNNYRNFGYVSAEDLDRVRETLTAEVKTTGIGKKFNSDETLWLDQLRAEILQMASQIDDGRSGYIANRVYTRFLHEVLDPHTGLILRSELNPERPEAFSGIGASIGPYIVEGSETNAGIVMTPLKKSPALMAGAKQGDVIVAVDGEDIRGWDVSDVVEVLVGPTGTEVTLTVDSFCDGTEKDIVITRGSVQPELPNSFRDSKFVALDGSDLESPKASICGLSDSADEDLETQTRNEAAQALYVPVKSFGPDACDNFTQALEKDLANPNSAGIIVDLRNNGGGSLGQVHCMLDNLISADGVAFDSLAVDPTANGFIVSNRQYVDRFGRATVGYFHKTGNFSSEGLRLIPGQEATSSGEAEDQPASYTYNRNVVVLINQFSASASEIFAGSIQDMERGWILGVQSFGKGSVQTVSARLAEQNGDQVLRKTTTALYTLASGRSPQHEGVTPDFPTSVDGTILTDEDIAELRSVSESSLFNAIQFNAEPWVQTRPEEVAKVSECVSNNGSANQARLYLQRAEEVDKTEALRVPTGNYQDAMALSVLSCSEERTDMIKFID